MAVAIVDEVALRESRLLVPRSAPRVPVRIDTNHPLARGCLAYVPLNATTKAGQRDLVSGRFIPLRAGYEADAPTPAEYARTTCVNNNKANLSWLSMPKQYSGDGVTLCIDILKTSAFTASASPFFSRDVVISGINVGSANDATKLGLTWNSAQYTWTGGPVLPVGEWITVGLTRNPGSGNQTVAVHLVSQSTGYQTASPGALASSSFDDLHIGDDEKNTARRFMGYIANARVYNRPLAASEFVELFKNPYQLLTPA